MHKQARSSDCISFIETFVEAMGMVLEEFYLLSSQYHKRRLAAYQRRLAALQRRLATLQRCLVLLQRRLAAHQQSLATLQPSEKLGKHAIGTGYA